jgi:hypothetical protein
VKNLNCRSICSNFVALGVSGAKLRACVAINFTLHYDQSCCYDGVALLMLNKTKAECLVEYGSVYTMPMTAHRSRDNPPLTVASTVHEHRVLRYHLVSSTVAHNHSPLCVSPGGEEEAVERQRAA